MAPRQVVRCTEEYEGKARVTEKAKGKRISGREREEESEGEGSLG